MLDKIKEKWSYLRFNYFNWWEFKWSVWAFFKYFKIVITMRPWDYAYVLKMMQFQLEVLKHNIFNGDELTDHKLMKVGDIERCIEIIDNQLSDDYYHSVSELKYGKLSLNHDWIDNPSFNGCVEFKNSNTEAENKINRKVFEYARTLEEKEWSELFRILENGNYIKKRRKFQGGLKSWWV